MTDNNPGQTAPTESVEQEGPQSTMKHRRGRAVPVLVALVVVLFLAAGAFGTLWFTEKGDHKATADQLTAARTDVDAAKAKGQKAEAREREANDKMMRNAGDQQKAQDKVGQAFSALGWISKGSSPCAAAGRKFAEVLLNGTSTESNEAMYEVGKACGT